MSTLVLTTKTKTDSCLGSGDPILYQPTCVKSDLRLGALCQVTEATVKSCADTAKIFPAVAESLIADSPRQCPRLRWAISSKDKNCPTKRDWIRLYSLYIPYLRALYYSLDKRHSYAAAKLAIPLLMNHINTLKEPRLAERRFRAMVDDLELIHALVGIAGNVTEETLRQFLEWMLRRGDGGNSGSGS